MIKHLSDEIVPMDLQTLEVNTLITNEVTQVILDLKLPGVPEEEA